MTAWWGELNNWWQMGVACCIAFLVHIFVKCVFLRALHRISEQTENDLDDRLTHFVKRFYLVLLFFVLIMVCLRINDIEITPFLASAGIVGIAIGMAAKETLADVLAGISLIADRPARIGDRVKIESIGKHWGSWGDVVDIGLRRTCIRNTDGVVVNYPNNILANSVITNFSFEDQPVRVRVRFQLNYNVDLDQAIEVATRSIQSHSEVLPDTAQVIVRSLWDETAGHAASGILMEGRYRISDVRNRTRIRSEVLHDLTIAFQKAGISLASPRVRVEQVED